MSLACLVYQGTLLVGLMGSSYRLNFPCVVVALAVLAIAGADGIDRVRRRYSRSFVANESQPVGAETTVSESLL